LADQALSQRDLIDGWPNGAKISVLIVDDSVVVRTMIGQMLDEHPEFTVVGQADRAERAIGWLSDNHADIILLDIEMPDRDGLSALPDVLAAGRGSRVVMVSSSTAQGAAITLRALAAGAADAIAKPSVGTLGRHFAADLIERLLRIGRSAIGKSTRHERGFNLRECSLAPISCVAIGASTGGVHALSVFFAALPRSFDAPILITQHLPAAFMPFFAGQLETMSGRQCRVAQTGVPIVRGAVYVAPGDRHLCCERSREGIVTRLCSGTVANHNLPSVDPMFSTMAETFSSTCVGIVLSGMGRDGVEGAAVLASQHADVLVQDAESSVVWGMPGVIASSGLASLCAPPGALAEHLMSRGAAQ
jgi:two-component system chemotaxis response regulator CheB